MNDWFSPQAGSWFSLFSLMSLMALMSYWVRQGRYRSFVIGSFVASICLGAALLAAAAVAWFSDQPAYVVRPLAMAGFAITVCFAATIGVVRKGYAEADQRRMLAKDI